MEKFWRAIHWRALSGVLVLLALSALGNSANAANWWETVKVKGDLRYRHELIDAEGKDGRTRQRIRARIGISGKVSEYTKVGFQLASGSSDPVSTNQTLDDAFSTKSVGIDLAYFTMQHKSLPGFTLTAGKMHNPFFTPGGSELIWDSDVNPEGGALNWDRELENVTVSLAGAGFWIDERSSSDDAIMGAVQGMARFHLNEKKSSVALGGSFYGISNTRYYAPFYDAEDAFGNSVVDVVTGSDTALGYATGFEMYELFGEVTHKFQTVPVKVMVDYVSNGKADSLETAWLIGLSVGKAAKPGQWEIRWNYRNVKSDAVLGVFTDSDFGGGGTNAKGHEFGGGVSIANNTTLALSYFVNDLDLRAKSTKSYKRLQADLQVKF